MRHVQVHHEHASRRPHVVALSGANLMSAACRLVLVRGGQKPYGVVTEA